ncbi:hypothetical protein Hamer_G026600, partial [Homarus americanus]
MRQMAEAMNKDNNMTAATFGRATIKDAITNITIAWKIHDLKGFNEGEGVKDIMKLVKEDFKKSKKDETELLVSMILSLLKKSGDGGDGKGRRGTPNSGKELTIPKLRFMQHITSATSVLQHDPDMEHCMQVMEALNRGCIYISAARLTDYSPATERKSPHSSIHYPHQVLAHLHLGEPRPSSSASRCQMCQQPQH